VTHSRHNTGERWFLMGPLQSYVCKAKSDYTAIRVCRRVRILPTVIPASRKRRRKGNPVVSDETVRYGYESSATLTTDRLHYKLQTSPLVREGPQNEEQINFPVKERKK
jgi:hypothetical protein